MKPVFDRVFGRLKALFDAYKMWIFFIALIGTNGGQQLYYHEPEKPVIDEKTIAKPTIIKPPIIIHKFDAELAKKLIKLELDKHKNGSQH